MAAPPAVAAGAAPAMALEKAAVEEVAVETVAVSIATVETPQAKTVTSEEIAKLAYSYWVERGYQGGNPHEDWARAEKALAAAI